MMTPRSNRLCENGKSRIVEDDGEVGQFRLSDLNIEMLLEIFFRLPISAIIRCKSVCKEWYNLISQPKFSNDYNRNSHFTYVLATQDWGAYDTTISLLEFSENGDFIQTKICPKVPIYHIQGLCNGLICSYSDEYGVPSGGFVCIINPISGEMIRLPDCKIDRNNGVFWRDYILGYSSSTNSFKVVRFGCNTRGNINERNIVKICTVGVDEKWRYLRMTLNKQPFRRTVVFNGAIHWMSEDSDHIEICTFDIGEEIEGQISIPIAVVSTPTRIKLAVLNNCLCLLDRSLEYQITIWMMKEYGVAKSWTKYVILGSWFPSSVQFCIIVPIVLLKNGDMLFSEDDSVSMGKYSVLSYNHGKKSCNKLRDFVSAYRFHLIETYTPRLLSLKEIIFGGQHNSSMES